MLESLIVPGEFVPALVAPGEGSWGSRDSPVEGSGTSLGTHMNESPCIYALAGGT